MIQTLKYITNHPLNKKTKLAAIWRYLGWQIGSRLALRPLQVSFVNNTRLLATPGMTGATGNIYCGLHEFETMAFCLHLLREGDLFCDIGANIGSYSILAASTGAKVIAFEPISEAYQHLLNNISTNKFEKLVSSINTALGPQKSFIFMTKNLDTTNRVVLENKNIDAKNIVKVPVDTLDNILNGTKPTLLKVDVEGFEEGVLEGARQALSSDSLIGVIVEINTPTIHGKILGMGFAPFRYLPFERKLEKLNSTNADSANTIYLKKSELAIERITNAKPFKVLNQEI